MEFNAKEQLTGLIEWMRERMAACGGKTAVIGISGGKDSSVVAALSVAAYGREMFNNCGYQIPDELLDYFDFEAYGESFKYDGIEEYSEGLIEIRR